MFFLSLMKIFVNLNSMYLQVHTELKSFANKMSSFIGVKVNMDSNRRLERFNVLRNKIIKYM